MRETRVTDIFSEDFDVLDEGRARFEQMVADLERRRQRIMNPLAATFEDYPYWHDWRTWFIHNPTSRQRLHDRYRRRETRVLTRDNWECFRCEDSAVIVHHASYHPFVMAGFADEWLYCLCTACHDIVNKRARDPAERWRQLHKRREPRIAYGSNLPSEDQIAKWLALVTQGKQSHRGGSAVALGGLAATYSV